MSRRAGSCLVLHAPAWKSSSDTIKEDIKTEMLFTWFLVVLFFRVLFLRLRHAHGLRLRCMLLAGTDSNEFLEVVNTV